ncbi:MAG: alpha/beta fold hydrolase [Planctomycetota bacterium]
MRHATWIALAVLTVLSLGTTAGAEGAKCPYLTAHEASLDPTEAEVEKAEAFRKLRVEFNGIQGDRVPSSLYVPTSGSAPYPAVLLQYGSGGHKGVDYIVRLGRQFAERGFVVLTIDSPGKGERDGEGAEILDWITSNKGREQFLQYCGDYSRAVDYMLTRDDVDGERIAFVGISWGAITGVTYAAHDPRVKAVCSILGGGGFLALTELLRGRGKGSIDPVRNVGLIAPRPLLLVNAKKDQIIPRAFSKALHRAAGDQAEKVWLDCDHLMNGVDPVEVGNQMIDFMLENLPNGPL